MRVIRVLRQYLDYERVLVVCHGDVIKALTGVKHIDLAGQLPFYLCP